jgi:hypothetical protein
MEWWSDGVAEWWRDGVVEGWSGGGMEWWSYVLLGFGTSKLAVALSI